MRVAVPTRAFGAKSEVEPKAHPSRGGDVAVLVVGVSHVALHDEPRPQGQPAADGDQAGVDRRLPLDEAVAHARVERPEAVGDAGRHARAVEAHQRGVLAVGGIEAQAGDRELAADREAAVAGRGGALAHRRGRREVDRQAGDFGRAEADLHLAHLGRDRSAVEPVTAAGGRVLMADHAEPEPAEARGERGHRRARPVAEGDLELGVRDVGRPREQAALRRAQRNVMVAADADVGCRLLPASPTSARPPRPPRRPEPLSASSLAATR